VPEDFMQSYDRRQLISLLRHEALKTGDYELPGGRTSHYFLDDRPVILSAEGAALIGMGILDSLIDLPGIQAIGGLHAHADTAIGTVLALAPSRGRPRLHGFLVQEHAGERGPRYTVAGPLQPGSVVAIVEDVAGTGRSALFAAKAVEAMGCTVARIVAVVDRLEGASEACAERGLSFKALVTIRDLGVEPIEPYHADFDPLPPLQGP
jgi:orotate phosphoribosyltransferase